MRAMSIENPWLTDTRVQARNLKKGTLEAKDLEKHLKELVDVSDKLEHVTLAQPALAGSEDDEDEDEDDDDGDADGE